MNWRIISIRDKRRKEELMHFLNSLFLCFSLIAPTPLEKGGLLDRAMLKLILQNSGDAVTIIKQMPASEILQPSYTGHCLRRLFQ